MNKRGPKVDALLGPLTRQTVMLDELAIQQLKVVGEGNLSDGCRRAARIAYDRYQRTPDVSLSEEPDALSGWRSVARDGLPSDLDAAYFCWAPDWPRVEVLDLYENPPGVRGFANSGGAAPNVTHWQPVVPPTAPRR